MCSNKHAEICSFTVAFVGSRGRSTFARNCMAKRERGISTQVKKKSCVFTELYRCGGKQTNLRNQSTAACIQSEPQLHWMGILESHKQQSATTTTASSVSSPIGGKHDSGLWLEAYSMQPMGQKLSSGERVSLLDSYLCLFEWENILCVQMATCPHTFSCNQKHQTGAMWVMQVNTVKS